MVNATSSGASNPSRNCFGICAIRVARPVPVMKFDPGLCDWSIASGRRARPAAPTAPSARKARRRSARRATIHSASGAIANSAK